LNLIKKEERDKILHDCKYYQTEVYRFRNCGKDQLLGIGEHQLSSIDRRAQNC